MIKALLNNKPMTFQELHTRLNNSHTKDSLSIELEFLMSIGKIIKVKENYKLLK
jgi:predicted transcriptional regulator